MMATEPTSRPTRTQSQAPIRRGFATRRPSGKSRIDLPLSNGVSEQPDRMDLHEFRNSRRRKTDNLLKEDHRDLKRFFALDSAAYRDLTAQGGLDEKTKELLGLVASTVLRCNDCIAYHCDRCVEVGWRKAELLDALNVALVVGGSITIPHIRTVWEVVGQLYGERDEKAAAPA